MCGIVGLWRWHERPEAYRDTVAEMLAFLRHRGPDEMGCYFDAVAGLGVARLAILDLEGGRQPLSDASGRFWIAYNGEVYNYLELRAELEAAGRRFATSSDTEVVLQAWVSWGEEALARLDGAFAFALYDRRESALLLARDRFGKRPLFYAVRGEKVAFASEVKAFLPVPGLDLDLDPGQLASIFGTWTPLPDQSAFRGIAQVPAGASLRLASGGSAQVRSYATLDLEPEPFAGSLDEASARTREALAESVRLRLRSDVEVGTYLSGGLDSSIVTALAVARAGGRVRSFAVSFDDPAFDETDAQQRTSAALGTRHTAVRVTGRDIADRFAQAIWHAEVPVFRTAFVPMLLLAEAVREAGIKVVLTGEGADEAFLGYNLFKEAALRSGWRNLAGHDERLRRIEGLYPYQAHVREHARSMALLFERFAEVEDPRLFSHALRFHNAVFATRLLRERRDPLAALCRLLDSEAPELASRPVLVRAQWLEIKTLLAGYLLSTQGDRMSLAYGVEGRCPFLDPAVVSWAAALPVDYRLRGGVEEKLVLRRAFSGLLPPEIAARPKQPYRAPDVETFQVHRPDYLEMVLARAEIERVEVLDPVFCARLAAKVLAAEPRRVSPRESQAFLFLLSTTLLHRLFCRRGHDVPAPIDDLLVRCVDGRDLDRGARSAAARGR